MSGAQPVETFLQAIGAHNPVRSNGHVGSGLRMQPYRHTTEVTDAKRPLMKFYSDVFGLRHAHWREGAAWSANWASINFGHLRSEDVAAGSHEAFRTDGAMPIRLKGPAQAHQEIS